MMSQESITKLFVDLVRKYNIVLEGFTEKQLIEAFKQAVACGDFERLITQDGRQQVVYIPFNDVERLRNRIVYLEKLIKENGIQEPQDELCQKP